MAGIVPGAEYGSTSHGVLFLPVMSEGNLAHAWALALHLGSRCSPVNQFLLFTARIQLSLSREHSSQLPSIFTGRCFVS